MITNWQDFCSQKKSLVDDWLADVLKMHPDGENNNLWVCFSMKKNHEWKNHWERAGSIKNYLMKLTQSRDLYEYDCYVSQEEFFSRKRTVENVASLRANFLDLDYKLMRQYREPPTPREWEQIILNHCVDFWTPIPNSIIYTGGGVHLKWIYDEPISRDELARWQFAQKLLLSQFKDLGADPNSADAARVLRVVGSENHKWENSATVRSVNRDFLKNNHFTFDEFVGDLETSTPRNKMEFAEIVDDWKKYRVEQEKIREEFLKSQAKIKANAEKLQEAEKLWLMTALNHHHPRGSYLQIDFGGKSNFIETHKLHETLREIFGAENLKMSMSEMNTKKLFENRFDIAYIPCNYVVLDKCPGKNFQEQKENILRRCREYRNTGIPEANQIISTKNFLLVEWTYTYALPGKAFTRWQDTQEFLCRHFEDWGAMENPEYLKATAMLPVAGFNYDGETAKLEYNALENQYTFDVLANAVLHFSQSEVEKYRQEKAEKKIQFDTARKFLNDLKLQECKRKKFAAVAYKRFLDIIKLLEMRQDNQGEIREDTRELCAFWALNCARQAGLITSTEDFKIMAENLIAMCGLQFKTECTINTLLSANRKNYHAKTATLIMKLHITPQEQKHLNVLILTEKVEKEKKKRISIERAKPWEALGISRSTWYRWRKAGKIETAFNNIIKKSCEEKKLFEPPYLSHAAHCVNSISTEKNTIYSIITTLNLKWREKETYKKLIPVFSCYDLE